MREKVIKAEDGDTLLHSHLTILMGTFFFINITNYLTLKMQLISNAFWVMGYLANKLPSFFCLLDVQRF